MIQSTEAQYATDCANCDHRIMPGDPIVLDTYEEGWSHRRCPEEAAFVACPACFISPCECED